MLMRLFGFDITRQKNYAAPVDNRGGWFPWIREAYAGAWQKNDEWRVDSVLAYPPVFACVTLIASDVAKLRPILMEQGADGIWTETDSAAFSPVLRKPNGYQNHIQFKEWWVISKLVRGNAYVLKERDNRGVVVRLYILDPCRVQPLVTTDGAVYYQLSQDSLAGVEETSITVPASEIIHDRMNCLFHPLVGVSPLFSCGESASQGLKIINDSSKFFANGARPGGVLTAPGAISDDTANRLKAHWDSNYTGDNAGKVAVLGDNLKFEPMRMNAVDSQLIEQLKNADESVCKVFHVPAYKVGTGAMPANTNVEALTQDYYSQCLQIHIEAMELCLDEGLAIPPKYRVELGLDGLFRMDTKTQMETLKVGVDGALITPNEGRRRINLKPLPGGDTVYMQQQNYSLAALNKRDSQDDPFAKTAAGEPATSDPEPEVNEENIEDQARMFALIMQKELSSAEHA